MTFRALLTNGYVIAGVAVVVIGAGAWAWVAHGSAPRGATIIVHPGTFVQQVSVSGAVEAAQNVDLGFAQSGRVSGVYASVGDHVRAGTTLAETDNGDLRAAVMQRQAALQAAEAQLASLQSGTRPEQIAVTQSQIASDQSSVMQADQSVVNAIQNAYTVSDDAIHNKVDQFFINPRAAALQLSFSTSNAQVSTSLLNDRSGIESVLVAWQASAATLSASSSNLLATQKDAQTNLALVTALLSDANAALNAAIPTGQITQSVINGYIANVAVARANVNAAQSAVTISATALQAAQAKLATDQKTLALEEAGATADNLRAQEAQVAAAQADVESAQAQLQKTIVSAPFDGIVTRMDAKIGAVVSPSVPQISMISSGLFQIQCYVPEVETAQVAVGDTASTTLDAYGAGTSFDAKVIAIDPAETEVNGVPTYKTTLQFLAADARIKSGMTANVSITTETIPDTFSVPQGAVFQKNGRATVQLLRGDEAVDVQVQTGAMSVVGDVQIVSGLSDGDVVLLNPQTAL